MIKNILKTLTITSLVLLTQKHNALAMKDIEIIKTNEQITINKINNILYENEYKHYGLHIGYNNIIKDYKNKKYIQEEVNRRLEEMEKIQEEKERQEQEELKRNSYNIEFTITHYGLSGEENGEENEGLNCLNQPLESGMVANNVLPLGTIIEFEDGSRVVVADRGGSDFNNSARLDKFVPTYDNNYLRKLGKYTIKGKIINE